MNIERVSHRAGYQVLFASGLFMITKSTRRKTGEFVTSSGDFSKSKVQEAAQHIRRIGPNSLIGPILLVRAFDVESP